VPETSGGAMNLEQRHLAIEGRDYWGQYVRLNGYAFQPNVEGLKKLSRNIDISISRLRHCITIYLEM
jgi:hypothetical protein